MCENAWSHGGGGSGGYTEHVFRHAAKELFNNELDQLDYRCQRNKDLLEVTLEKGDSVVLRMAIANGFRNIQNITQQMKRGKCHYDYVEVMACPSGCLNGGGQITAGSISERNEILRKVTELYKGLPVITPAQHEGALTVFRDWFPDGCDSKKAKELLYTDFHAIESDTSNAAPSNVAW